MANEFKTFVESSRKKLRDEGSDVYNDLPEVVEFFKKFLEEKYSRITFENITSYTYREDLVKAYFERQKKVMGDSSLKTKEGLLIETGYLNFPLQRANGDSSKGKTLSKPFFYIISPMIGEKGSRLVFFNPEQITSDWTNEDNGYFIYSDRLGEELADKFIECVDIYMITELKDDKAHDSFNIREKQSS